MTIHTTEAFRRQIDSLLPYAVPLLVYPRDNAKIDDWRTGGTALLARTKQNRFLVTADHFVAEVEKLRQRVDIVVLLGTPGASFTDITPWPIIARDDSVDICTFQVPDEMELRELDKYCFDLDLAQSRRAAVGDQVLILGFPKSHRQASGSSINTRVLPIMDFVTHVGDRRFTVADETSQREILINPDNLSFPGHVGGMSGAPAFRISDSAPPSLVGILSESGDGLHGVHFCVHADFILPDGSLDLGALPPR